MIDITFPDGNVKQYEEGVTPFEVARSISEGLARNIISAEFNGKKVETVTPLTENGTIKLFSWDSEEGKEAFWHSSAHVLAQTIEHFYPDVKLTIGPAIDNGFYYDVDLGDETISDNDFAKMEKKFLEFAREKHTFQMRDVSKADALAMYKGKNEYKIELIENLNDGEITFCDHANFTDLCRGGHIPNTGLIKAVKITSVAGAYWRGDENNAQLTRVYGISFPKQKLLEEWIEMMEEAKKRDHRKLGKELEIFTFDDDVGPGLPLWLPNGAFLIEQLERLAKATEDEMGYDRVRTPHLAKENLYLTSGHLPYYKESMFPPMEMDGSTYYLKAMNCPHHHKIFDHKLRSYKDLPVRLAEYGTCYRYEKSGELFGLMRVRSLQMNDAHIYCTKEQFEDEFKAVNEMYIKYFKTFGIDKYVMRFSTHSPEKLGKKYVDNAPLWKETEGMVRKVLEESNMPYVEIEDEAAFYGPKIDVQVWSAIGKEFTLATNQVDFAQPISFNLTYTNANNEQEHPIIIHRAPLSTHERLIGFLIEHYAGNFPLWLSPKQVGILPISDKYNEYAQKVSQLLKKYDIRSFVDSRSEKVGRKIRDTELQKVPYMLIIGEKEEDSNSVSVRKHGEGDQGTMSAEEFAEKIKKEKEAMLASVNIN